MRLGHWTAKVDGNSRVRSNAVQSSYCVFARQFRYCSRYSGACSYFLQCRCSSCKFQRQRNTVCILMLFNNQSYFILGQILMAFPCSRIQRKRPTSWICISLVKTLLLELAYSINNYCTSITFVSKISIIYYSQLVR